MMCVFSVPMKTFIISKRSNCIYKASSVTESYEPRSEKIGLRGIRPGTTQPRLCSLRLEISDLESRGIVVSV